MLLTQEKKGSFGVFIGYFNFSSICRRIDVSSSGCVDTLCCSRTQHYNQCTSWSGQTLCDSWRTSWKMGLQDLYRREKKRRPLSTTVESCCGTSANLAASSINSVGISPALANRIASFISSDESSSFTIKFKSSCQV